MMRPEGTGSPAPSGPPGSQGGVWRRFLNRLGFSGRSRGTGPPPHQGQWSAPNEQAAPQPYGAPNQYAGPQQYGAPHGYAPPQQTFQQAPSQQPPVPAVPATPAAEPEQNLATATLAGLAMRDLTLVDSLMGVVEELEDTTEDPELLEKLFKIDNLATRMRRNGENLLVLAGQDSGDPSPEPIPLLDVARAAISEISEYQRIQVGNLPDLFLSGSAADDISHLLAELMDNATEKSPDHAQVVVSAQKMADERLLVTIEDEGIGVPADQLAKLNERLRGEPILDEQVMRHMGLYVVSRIAHRHGLQVQLEQRAFRGVNAHVAIPAEKYSTTGPRPAPQPVSRSVPPPPPPQAPSTPPRQAQESGTASKPQEDSKAMDSPVTSAGLPRRSAHRNTVPVPMAPPTEDDALHDSGTGTEGAKEGGSGPEDGVSRAERIRADLEGFLEGQEAADPDE